MSESLTPFQKNLERAMRVYLFFSMSVYGWGKLAGDQFFLQGNVPADIARKTLVEATAHDIAWVFFGYSTLYLWFIGLSQALGAILLLFEKTKLLGVAVLIPILVNVIVVDVCYGVSPGPLMSAILYLLWVGVITYLNREKVMAVLRLAMDTGGVVLRTGLIRLSRHTPVIVGIMAGMALLELGLFLFLHFTVRETKDFWFFDD